jgi:hypothetical protein
VASASAESGRDEGALRRSCSAVVVLRSDLGEAAAGAGDRDVSESSVDIVGRGCVRARLDGGERVARGGR